MTTDIDLWGELPGDSLVTPPSAVLQKQAALLAKKTDGKLVGNVESFKTRDESMAFHFEVMAPYLDNYTFRIMTFVHPVTLYPVTLLDRVNGGRQECADEDGFVAAVGEILASQNVRKVLGALLAQTAHRE